MSIDLNADLGEGLDEVDRVLLEIVTSANVACGFHAGDESVARRVCRAAGARGVAVGAHVGYRDRDGFGRRELGTPPEVVAAEAAEQMAALEAWAGSEGVRVTYVKPHGALYTRASVDADCAAALVRAAVEAGGLAMLGLPGSALLVQAHAAGLAAFAEGFADRAYRPDGSLVPRSETGAVLEAEDALEQAVRLAAEGVVDSLCLHGDTPGVAALGRRVRDALTAAGVELRRFA